SPDIFFKMAAILKKWGLVEEKKYQFAMGNFDSAQKRRKVFRVWMVLRKIRSKMSVIKEVLREHNIPMHLFFGRHDLIIPPSIGIRFQRGSEKSISLTILETGHRLLKESTLREVAANLDSIKNDVGKTPDIV